jgi:hypothetical protein
MTAHLKWPPVTGEITLIPQEDGRICLAGPEGNITLDRNSAESTACRLLALVREHDEQTDPSAARFKWTTPAHPYWIQTHSGVAFDLLDPRVRSVRLGDVAVALSRVNRFVGHTMQPYSVARHSLLVAQLLRENGHDSPVILQGLLHDATEAYLCDLPSPLKALLPGYRRIEARLWSVVSTRFGMSETLHPAVKEADGVALRAEAWNLLLSPPVDAWAGEPPVLSDMAEAIMLRQDDPDVTSEEWRTEVRRNLSEEAASGWPVFR